MYKLHIKLNITYFFINFNGQYFPSIKYTLDINILYKLN